MRVRVRAREEEGARKRGWVRPAPTPVRRTPPAPLTRPGTGGGGTHGRRSTKGGDGDGGRWSVEGGSTLGDVGTCAAPAVADAFFFHLRAAPPRGHRSTTFAVSFLSFFLFLPFLFLSFLATRGRPTDSILVRAYDDRSDLLRSMIIGPENTPYEDAPFVIDWMLDSNFPQTPPVAHFLSWTNGNGRGACVSRRSRCDKGSFSGPRQG